MTEQDQRPFALRSDAHSEPTYVCCLQANVCRAHCALLVRQTADQEFSPLRLLPFRQPV